MKRLITISLLLFIISFSLVLFFEKGLKSSTVNEGFLDIKDIKKGMKGYGLSVFSGYKPKRFDVSIIGVLRGEGARGNLILARFSGASLEQTGVVAGMSGSPVYINGKLVGAISHTFPWSKEPIGAIRPIGEMLRVLNGIEHKQIKKEMRFIPLDLSLRKALRDEYKAFARYQNDRSPYDSNSYTAYLDKREIRLVPVKTPILFSGISENILSIMRLEMERHGFFPLNYGSGGKIAIKDKLKGKLNPGDAVGIPLITGDMHAVPVGTVTYRKGNKVLIFGHPSFFRGPINMPMSKEYIHTVIPNREISFKLSSTMSIVGRIFNDKNSAVAGELGKFSKTIPVSVEVKEGTRRERFNFSIVKDNIFFPNMLVSAIMQSALAINSKTSLTSLKLKFIIKVKDLKTGRIKNISISDFFSGNQTHKNLFDALFRLSVPLEAVMFNPFIDVSIISINAFMEINYGWLISEIVDVSVLKNRLKAGDIVPLLVTLRNYKGREFYKKISIKLPYDLDQDKLILGVASSKVAMSTDRLMSNERYIARSFNHLISILNKDERFNDLVVWIDIPQKGLIIDGNEHPSLPSSILSIMESNKPDGNNVIYKRIKKVFRTNYLIYGAKTLPLNVILKK